MPTVKRTRDQREERVQLQHGDQHDDHRDAGQCGEDQLPAAGDGFDEVGPGEGRTADKVDITVLLGWVERVETRDGLLDDGVDALVDVDHDAPLVRLRAARGWRTARPAARPA